MVGGDIGEEGIRYLKENQRGQAQDRPQDKLRHKDQLTHPNTDDVAGGRPASYIHPDADGKPDRYPNLTRTEQRKLETSAPSSTSRMLAGSMKATTNHHAVSKTRTR